MMLFLDCNDAAASAIAIHCLRQHRVCMHGCVRAGKPGRRRRQRLLQLLAARYVILEPCSHVQCRLAVLPTRMLPCVHVFGCACACVYVHVRACVQSCMCARAGRRVRVCMHAHACVRECAHECAHMCTYTCLAFVRACACVRVRV